MNKENAITLVALIITIILMMILLGVGIHFGTEAINKARLEDIVTDMLLIKTRAKIIADEFNFNGNEEAELPGVQCSDEELNSIGLNNLSNEEKQKIRKWNYDTLQSQGLSEINPDEYIVQYDLDNPNNCEVYYIKGIQEEKSLTQLQEK